MLEQVMADNGFPVPLVEGGNCRVFQFHSGTGEGIMTQYDLFPGVSLMYNDFHMESYDSAFRTTEDASLCFCPPERDIGCRSRKDSRWRLSSTSEI